MPYATLQNLIDRFGETEIVQLTDRNGDDLIDTPVVDQALADADAEIDGHLQGRYTLPLPSKPKILVTYACDIARYRLYDERAPDQVRKRYEDAQKFLRAVSEGKVSLGLDTGSEPTPITGGPAHESPGRVFTHETLDDY